MGEMKWLSEKDVERASVLEYGKASVQYVKAVGSTVENTWYENVRSAGLATNGFRVWWIFRNADIS